MRFVALCLTSITLIGFSVPRPAVAAEVEATAGAVKIVRVWTAWRDAPSFVRLGAMREESSEPGHATILRSHAEQREGYYFTIRVQSVGRRAHLPDGQIRLLVVAPDAAIARTYTFPFVGGNDTSAQVLVGLTGADWTYGDRMPLAWRIEIVNADGALLTHRNSFLWEKPAPNHP